MRLLSNWFQCNPGVLVQKCRQTVPAGISIEKNKKYTEPVSQETELQGCSIDGNLDSTESGAGGYARSFVKDPSWMESLLTKNYTSRWSSKYLVRLPAVLVEHRDDL